MIHKLYEGTVELEFKEASHRYKVNGVFMPGVTTVCGVLFKDLTDWASWMAVEAFKEAVMPFATTTNKIPKVELKKLADNAKKAHRVKSQRGKDVGTIAHEWIREETAAGREIKFPDYGTILLDNAAPEDDITEIRQHIAAAEHCVKSWRKWMKDYDIEIIKSEFCVYSKQLGYCGTADVFFRSRRTGKVYMGDYKTSEPQKIRNAKYQIIRYTAYPEHFAQIAAYDHAYHEEFDVTPDGYMVIYLPKEGEYQVFMREQVGQDREGWENLFKTYQWMDSIRKGK